MTSPLPRTDGTHDSLNKAHLLCALDVVGEDLKAKQKMHLLHISVSLNSVFLCLACVTDQVRSRARSLCFQCLHAQTIYIVAFHHCIHCFDSFFLELSHL